MCHPHGLGEPTPVDGVTRRDVVLPVEAGEAMPARICVPEADPPWGAVAIAVDIYGANRFYKGVAERLAAAGCAAILPDIFFREGELPEVTRDAAFARRGELDDERALRDLSAALDFLTGETGTPGATLGFCLGGNLVFHLSTRREDAAVVAYYGFPGGLPAPKGLARPLDVVERLRGPLLAFWGERDEKVGMDNVEAFSSAVRAAGIEYEPHVYPDVEHGFLVGLDEDPTGANYAPAHDSWERTLAFLRRSMQRSE